MKQSTRHRSRVQPTRHRALAAFLVTLLLGAPAHATTFFEVNIGERPVEAERYMPQLFRILSDQYKVSPPDVVAREFRYAPQPGVTDKKITAAEIVENIELGYRQAARMDYGNAVSTLTQWIGRAADNEQTFVAEPNARSTLMRALVQLGISYYAQGDIGNGASAFADLARMLDGQPLKGFSDAAQQKYNLANGLLAKSQSGKVLITVNEPESQIFLNGIGVGRSGTYSAGKLPGSYRALVIVKDKSLRYNFNVPPGGEIKLELDWAFENALVVSPNGVRLQFAAKPSAEKMLQYIDRLSARTKSDNKIVTFTLAHACGALGLTARSYVRGATLRADKVAHVVIDEEEPEVAMHSLVRFMLRGEESSSVKLGDHATMCAEAGNGEVAEADEGRSAGTSSSWMTWTSLGMLVGGLAAGGLSVKFALDGRSAGDELQVVCADTCTSEQARTLLDKQSSANRNALISGIAGGGLALGAGVMFFLSRRSGNTTQVSVVPTPGGGFATVGLRF